MATRHAITAIGLLFASASLGADLNVPADFATIQEAVDAAMSGDTILVAPGTYEGFNTYDLELTVEAVDAGTATITSRIDTFDDHSPPIPLTIDGFVFRNTTVYAGNDGTAMTIRNCVFIECGDGSGSMWDGVIAGSQVFPITIESCRFVRSTAPVVNIQEGIVSVRDSEVLGGVAGFSSLYGTGGQLSLTNVAITGTEGGAVEGFVFGVTLTGCRLIANKGHGVSAAGCCGPYGRIVIVDSTINANDGFGVFCQDCFGPVELSNSRICENGAGQIDGDWVGDSATEVCPLIEPVPAPCIADLDGSGHVGFGDLSLLLQMWGACPAG